MPLRSRPKIAGAFGGLWKVAARHPRCFWDPDSKTTPTPATIAMARPTWTVSPSGLGIPFRRAQWIDARKSAMTPDAEVLGLASRCAARSRVVALQQQRTPAQGGICSNLSGGKRTFSARIAIAHVNLRPRSRIPSSIPACSRGSALHRQKHGSSTTRSLMSKGRACRLASAFVRQLWRACQARGGAWPVRGLSEMALIDQLANAQNGQFFANAGKAAGLSPEQMRSTMDAICPAIARPCTSTLNSRIAWTCYSTISRTMMQPLLSMIRHLRVTLRLSKTARRS